MSCEISLRELLINQFSTNIQGTRMGLPAERMMAEVKEELNSPNLVVMDRNLKDYDSFGVNVDLPFRSTNIAPEKSNKCNQCNYASSSKSSLKSHLKMHSGEKSNKCNQCNFASSRAGHLMRHLKIHRGEKPNNCNQCNYACSQASTLRRH